MGDRNFPTPKKNIKKFYTAAVIGDGDFDLSRDFKSAPNYNQLVLHVPTVLRYIVCTALTLFFDAGVIGFHAISQL